MAIQKEIWVRDIAENLFKDSSFLNLSIDDQGEMDGSAKVVSLPQSGAAPSAEKNRSSLPATASERTDTVVTYPVDEFTSDPVVVRDVDQLQVSYDKRANVLRDHVATLEELIADELAHNWAPGASQSGQYVRTSGADRAAYKSYQTLTRKAVAKADIISMRRILDGQNIPQAGRILLIDSDLHADLLGISEFVDADKIGFANLVDGAVGRILGFDVMIRSSVVMYDNTGTPVKKAVGAAGAATDNIGSIAYHPNFVRRAIGGANNGGIKVFSQEDDPTWYGSLFSAMVLAGGRPRYTNYRGVVSLIEAA